MSGYLAVVKYAVDDTDAKKIAALKEGIEECAMRLVEEFGVSKDDVERSLEDAMTAVEWAQS